MRLVIIIVSLLGAAVGCSDPSEAPSGPATTDASQGTLEEPVFAAETDSGANRAPVIQAIRFEPATLNPGERLRAVVKNSDPDGDPVYLSFTWTLNGQPVASRDADVVLPKLRRGDRVEVTVEATDSAGHATRASQQIEMANRAPRVLGIDVANETDEQDRPRWRVDPAGEDPDGERLEYEIEWFVNGQPRGEGETFSKAGLSRGDEVHVRVTASDGDKRSEALESAKIEIGNKAPDIVSTPPGLDPSGRFVYQVEAEDPDRDRAFLYSLDKAPEGMSIGKFDGRIVWAPSFEQAGRHPIEVVVDDRKGGRTKQRFHLSVQVEESPPASP